MTALQSVDSRSLLLQIGTGRDTWCGPRRLGPLTRRPERFGGHEGGGGVVSGRHALPRAAEGERGRGRLLLLCVETSEHRRRASSRNHLGAGVWDETTRQGRVGGRVRGDLGGLFSMFDVMDW